MKSEDVFELFSHLAVIQKVAVAILAAKEACREPEFLAWANAWLEGKDRTPQSAMAAIRNLPTGTVVAPVAPPASLRRPKLSGNARTAARCAAEAAAKVRTPGMKTEDIVRRALRSAIAENQAIDLNALAGLARKIC